jgi:nucleotide-binding universal stress UspA family protein
MSVDLPTRFAAILHLAPILIDTETGVDGPREMQTRIMLVFDALAPTHEALRYSVELAQRMRARLVLLMLLTDDVANRVREGSGPSDRFEDEVEELLAACVEPARKAEVPVEWELRIGDPSSELMKFLAETRPVHSIVWGGDGEAVRRRERLSKGHWFARMRDRVELPVVVPVPKT